MARIDSDLRLDYDKPQVFKKSTVWHEPEVFFQQGFNPKEKSSKK